MTDALSNAGIFLLQLIFDLYIFILLLRFVLQAVRANFYNPVSQFVIKMTNPVVTPLRSIIPSYKNYDLSILLLMFLFEAIKLAILIPWLKVSFLTGLGALLLLAFAQLCSLAINFFFFAILIVVIIHWINPHTRHPAAQILFLITAPLLRLAQRYIPLIAGIDLSPLVVMVLLKL